MITYIFVRQWIIFTSMIISSQYTVLLMPYHEYFTWVVMKSYAIIFMSIITWSHVLCGWTNPVTLTLNHLVILFGWIMSWGYLLVEQLSLGFEVSMWTVVIWACHAKLSFLAKFCENCLTTNYCFLFRLTALYQCNFNNFLNSFSLLQHWKSGSSCILYLFFFPSLLFHFSVLFFILCFLLVIFSAKNISSLLDFLDPDLPTPVKRVSLEKISLRKNRKKLNCLNEISRNILLNIKNVVLNTLPAVFARSSFFHSKCTKLFSFFPKQFFQPKGSALHVDCNFDNIA